MKMSAESEMPTQVHWRAYVVATAGPRNLDFVKQVWLFFTAANFPGSLFALIEFSNNMSLLNVL